MYFSRFTKPWLQMVPVTVKGLRGGGGGEREGGGRLNQFISFSFLYVRNFGIKVLHIPCAFNKCLYILVQRRLVCLLCNNLKSY